MRLRRILLLRKKELGDERRLCWARNMKDYRTWAQRVVGDDPNRRRRCPSTIVGPGSDGQDRAGCSSKQLIGKAGV